MGDRRGQYPRELRERAVRLVLESRDQYQSEWAAMASIAAQLGIGTTETLRKWVRSRMAGASGIRHANVRARSALATFGKVCRLPDGGWGWPDPRASFTVGALCTSEPGAGRSGIAACRWSRPLRPGPPRHGLVCQHLANK
jgi:hypothetical protein